MSADAAVDHRRHNQRHKQIQQRFQQLEQRCQDTGRTVPGQIFSQVNHRIPLFFCAMVPLISYSKDIIIIQSYIIFI